MKFSIRIPRLSERSSVELVNIARAVRKDDLGAAYGALLRAFALLRAPRLVP